MIDGGLWFGDRWCPAGTHVELPYGCSRSGRFAPATRAPKLFEVMMGDARSWGDRPEVHEAALAEQGVTPLPDPPIGFPDWLADLRTHWTGSAEPADPA